MLYIATQKKSDSVTNISDIVLGLQEFSEADKLSCSSRTVSPRTSAKESKIDNKSFIMTSSMNKLWRNKYENKKINGINRSDTHNVISART